MPKAHEKHLPLKAAVYSTLIILLYILLPIFLTITHRLLSVKWATMFYFVNILIIIYLFKNNFSKRRSLECQLEEIQEKLNILDSEILKGHKNNADLKVKIERYSSLKNVVEDLNRNLDFDSVAASLLSSAFSLVSNNKGVCILYLIDKHLNLQVFKTEKEDKNLVIKAKEGDLFDFWVLRHAIPLLIEDVKKDFRFDLDKLKNSDLREIRSLISSPLLSEHRFLGTLRLDNTGPQLYSQDDLRFLASICELGAVALENSELFKRTQELAIHDGLTGLYTKGYFLERLKDECRRGVRKGQEFSLLMIDIDFFKNYNDKFGHTAGDIVLKKISLKLAEALKNLSTTISRFGGEEFCIVMHNTVQSEAFKLADNLRKMIENEKVILRRQKTNVTVSIGLASFPNDAIIEDELILKADKAMYEAKQKGRNQVCCI